jgi:hypothetical protein
MMRPSKNENTMKKKTEKQAEGSELRREYDLSKLKGGYAADTSPAIEQARTLYCCRRMSLSISLTSRPSIRPCVA